MKPLIIAENRNPSVRFEAQADLDGDMLVDIMFCSGATYTAYFGKTDAVKLIHHLALAFGLTASDGILPSYGEPPAEDDDTRNRFARSAHYRNWDHMLAEVPDVGTLSISEIEHALAQSDGE